MRIEIGNPLTAHDVERIIAGLGEIGRSDIEWAEGLEIPASAEDFALEAIFVICNSGMKNTVARGIFNRVRDELLVGNRVSPGVRTLMGQSPIFRHVGKARAIDIIWDNRDGYFASYVAAADKLEFCGKMPWIGGITKYHLAKNFGVDVAKPDVHLQRLADREGCTPQQLCERLAGAMGYRVATIDTLLWRACANGLIDPRRPA
jgi:hypothetical protein